MNIKLSDHFTYKRLFRFVFPSIMMMIFTSIYGAVDGFFVSNYVGKTEFAAVNLIFPFPMMIGAIGFMIGAGGSALVSMTLGQGKPKEANEIFSMLVKVTGLVGVVLSAIGFVFLREIALLLGATPDMIDYSVTYGRFLMVALPFFMLQNVFQSFLVTAEKPGLGLVVTVAAGLTNVVLDFAMIGVLRLGIVGAALATGLSQVVGGLVPLVYFLCRNNSPLKLVRSKMNFSALGKTCFNGSSELMTNVSMSLVNMLYNRQLLHYAGESGVVAYGVIMYTNFIFVAVFIGYAVGTAPIIGYNYGAGNKPEMQNVFKKSMGLNIGAGKVMTISAIALSGVLSGIFVGYDAELLELTQRGFIIYSVSFLVMGINIYGSSFFTALGNGLVSAIISFLRTLLFQVAAVLLLPMVLEIDGIWMSIVTAEVVAMVVTVAFMVANKKKYGY